MPIRVHKGDLPDLARYTGSVAIDTETLGLDTRRDRLCVVQLSPGDGSADVVQIAMDEDGMRIDELEETLDRLEREGRRPKFIYTIPTFQNPSGVSMPAQRRREIAEVLLRTGAPLVEDDPYGELRFEGETAPQIAALPGQLPGDSAQQRPDGVQRGVGHPVHHLLRHAGAEQVDQTENDE